MHRLQYDARHSIPPNTMQPNTSTSSTTTHIVTTHPTPFTPTTPHPHPPPYGGQHALVAPVWILPLQLQNQHLEVVLARHYACACVTLAACSKRTIVYNRARAAAASTPTFAFVVAACTRILQCSSSSSSLVGSSSSSRIIHGGAYRHDGGIRCKRELRPCSQQEPLPHVRAPRAHELSNVRPGGV